MSLLQRLRQELERSNVDRWWDTFAVGLLLAGLIVVAQRLIVTQWTEHLGLVRTLILLGGLAGLALGQSGFRPRRTAALGFAYGLFAIPWQLGLTLVDLPEGVLWIDRLADMVSRMSIALGQMARQEPVPDPLLFLFSMACLYWTLGVHAGYTLTRRARPWQTVFPAGLTLLIIHGYDPLLASRGWFLALYLTIALTFVARLIYLRHRARWKQNNVFLHSYVGVDLSRITVQITVALVLIAWTVPVIASALSPAQNVWERVNTPWIALRDRLENAVAPLRDHISGVYNFYGENLALGQGTKPVDDVVLAIEPQPNPPVSFRYYWRSRVYDTYVDGGWHNTVVSDTRRVSPGRVGLSLPEPEERWTSVFTVTTAIPVSALYGPPEVVWTGRSAQADLAYNLDGTVDVVAWRASPPLRAGETYQVRSSLSTVTIAQLQTAGTDYPTWVTDRYLQLPPGIPPRVYALARQITTDLDNPYEMAAAITSYLRAYIRYSETIDSRRPSGREPVDWFLFDLREGFCTYYASAEIVMLRSLGIPARLAAGFAQGEPERGGDVYLVSQRNRNYQSWQEDSDIYVVRRSDSHAWPEVYFPDLGWIEFEPTVSQPVLYRPLGEDWSDLDKGQSSFLDFEEDLRNRWEEALGEEGMAPAGGALSDSFGAANSVPKVAFWALAVGLSLSVIALVWQARRPADLPPFPVLLKKGLRRFDLQPPAILNRWALHATLPSLVRAYLEINYALKRLGAPPDPAATPAERVRILSRLLPEATEPAHHLLAGYHAVTYSQHRGNLLVGVQAGRDIRALSWRAAIRQRFGRG